MERLLGAAKYRGIHPATIADVVGQEVDRSSSRADLERRSRLTLHKTAALYLLTTRRSALLRDVQLLGTDDTATRRWCRSVLGSHFSTAERLADLDDFYPTLFALTGPVHEVADLACALNPLTLPWLRQATAARYVGYDFNRFYVELGTAFIAPRYLDCLIVHGDVLLDPQGVSADVALLLKTYHCIEDRRAGAGLELVDVLRARHVVVSFPLRAMNGRIAAFAERHSEKLLELAEKRGWAVCSARLSSEELFVISKGAHPLG